MQTQPLNTANMASATLDGSREQSEQPELSKVALLE